MSDTILLVEDHEANRSVLKRRLERRGYAVAEAADGAEAIAKFCAAPPDLVIMDLSMPNMSGLEALQHIRASGKGVDVPVIALTAHAMDEMREKCLASGFADFLTKPLNFDALLDCIVSLKGAAR